MPDWAARVSRTKLIGPGLGQGAVLLGTHTCSAASTLISPLAGPGWVAAGDAAYAFEPLSSQGIAKALRSGCFAAYCALDSLNGKAETARARYEALVQGEFTHYRAALARHYGAETRWPEAEFWRRRLTPA
ncbi:NAD(P)/FAD-dependent oxidoreductase [Elstera litoralis]|uniref:NAD(P)/FAD-dependent oxidoreductase n=1 Tax=Elstera litoralis TaxID=552518 RepID=UPI0006988073|nr:tryptophan 7-halogenase [Elstera litoralis]